MQWQRVAFYCIWLYPGCLFFYFKYDLPYYKAALAFLFLHDCFVSAVHILSMDSGIGKIGKIDTSLPLAQMGVFLMNNAGYFSLESAMLMWWMIFYVPDDLWWGPLLFGFGRRTMQILMAFRKKWPACLSQAPGRSKNFTYFFSYGSAVLNYYGIVSDLGGALLLVLANILIFADFCNEPDYTGYRTKPKKNASFWD